MRLALVLLAVVGAVSVVACGDAPGGGASGTRGPAADAAPEVVVKARAEALFAAAKEGGAKIAPFVAYKGKDDARRYKEAALGGPSRARRRRPRPACARWRP